MFFKFLRLLRRPARQVRLLAHALPPLLPEVGYRNPEAYGSSIPGEKGFQFLYYIETLVGEDLMQSLVNYYWGVNSLGVSLNYTTFQQNFN